MTNIERAQDKTIWTPRKEATKFGAGVVVALLGGAGYEITRYSGDAALRGCAKMAGETFGLPMFVFGSLYAVYKAMQFVTRGRAKPQRFNR